MGIPFPDSQLFMDNEWMSPFVFIGGDKSSNGVYPLHTDGTPTWQAMFGVTGFKHFWMFDRRSEPFLNVVLQTATKVFGACAVGEGENSPPMSWLRPYNMLTNFFHAFFFPLARGWYASIGPGDLLLFPP